jgi:hypothetical protein
MSVDVRIKIVSNQTTSETKFEVHKDHYNATDLEKAIGEELRQLACRLVDVYLETLKAPEIECEQSPSTSKVITTES